MQKFKLCYVLCKSCIANANWWYLYAKMRSVMCYLQKIRCYVICKITISCYVLCKKMASAIYVLCAENGLCYVLCKTPGGAPVMNGLLFIDPPCISVSNGSHNGG